MRIYLIRHADPDYPNNTITPAGHLEAKALARRMAAVKPDRIYSSPLGRAVDTARYSAELLKMTPTVEEWTQELSGCDFDVAPWGKLVAWDVPGEIIRAREPYPGRDDWHQMPCFTPEVVREKYEALRRNSDAFLARHGYAREGGRYRIERGSREKIAVFCHGGFGLSWLAHLLEIPLPIVWSGFWLPPSSVTTILMDERSREWAVPRCIGVGDVSHLYEAGLPTQPSGIKANYD